MRLIFALSAAAVSADTRYIEFDAADGERYRFELSDSALADVSVVRPDGITEVIAFYNHSRLYALGAYNHLTDKPDASIVYESGRLVYAGVYQHGRPDLGIYWQNDDFICRAAD